jgi:hypothetical protein
MNFLRYKQVHKASCISRNDYTTPSVSKKKHVILAFKYCLKKHIIVELGSPFLMGSTNLKYPTPLKKQNHP